MTAETQAQTRPGRAELVTLAVLLLLAAALRFAHLDAGLRHTPHMDERYFVESAAHMLATRSLDWGWYEYPGLMFYLLVPVEAAAGASDPPGPTGYLAARALIAACGVLAVGLGWLFARRFCGPLGALFAAALLALSPVHVETAHMLRPDVVLECLLLLLFLAILRLDGSARRDLAAGALLGLAVGLKFSGALGLVPLSAAILLGPGSRLRRLALCGTAAAAVFVASSPYLVLAGAASLEGIASQVLYHYQQQPVAAEPYLPKLLAYASVWPKALGWPALVLAAFGLASTRPQWRRLAPFVPLPVLTAMLFATTGYFFNRHLIPSMSIVAVLAGLGLQALALRSRALAPAVGALCLAPPLLATLGYVNAVGRPSTRDRAADWLEAHLQPPARVLAGVPGLQVDPARFELLRPKRLEHGGRVLADECAAIASLEDDEPLFADLPVAQSLEPLSPWEGPRILLRYGPGRAAGAPVSLQGARLSASDGRDALEALRDGRLDTFWSVSPARGEREWLELDFDAPVRLARVELKLGDRPEDAGRGLTLEAASAEGRYERVAAFAARPPVREQLTRPDGHSEVLAFAPREATRFRIVRQAGAKRWSVAELELRGPRP